MGLIVKTADGNCHSGAFQNFFHENSLVIANILPRYSLAIIGFKTDMIDVKYFQFLLSECLRQTWISLFCHLIIKIIVSDFVWNLITLMGFFFFGIATISANSGLQIDLYIVSRQNENRLIHCHRYQRIKESLYKFNDNLWWSCAPKSCTSLRIYYTAS